MAELQLRILEGSQVGTEFELTEAVTVGRDPALKRDGGIVIDDEEVSRRHVSIRPDHGEAVIEDLGSANGTWVGDSRIAGAHQLASGQTIRIGTTVLELVGRQARETRVRQQPTWVPKVEIEPPAPPPPPPNSIEVEGLVREFKKGPRAVDGIDLYVEPGEIYGFLGPNGAGKSTTVHMLTTLLPPTAGTARVAGHDVVKEGAAVRGSIGVALQEAALDPLLTAYEHMQLQTALQGVPKNARGQRAEALLGRVGLTDAAGRRVGGYSGGMKRRLDLALALVHGPRILFLDEPTTGLDPHSRSDLWDEVNRLADDEGVTVFLTTQYMEEADLLADRVGIIVGGKIVAEGTPEALKAEIGQPTVEVVPQDDGDRRAVEDILARFGEASAAAHKGASVRLRRGVGDLADIVRALDSASIPLANLELHAPTLDDVFLAKTGRSIQADAEEAVEVPGSGIGRVSLPGQPMPPSLR